MFISCCVEGSTEYSVGTPASGASASTSSGKSRETFEAAGTHVRDLAAVMGPSELETWQIKQNVPEEVMHLTDQVQ